VAVKVKRFGSCLWPFDLFGGRSRLEGRYGREPPLPVSGCSGGLGAAHPPLGGVRHVGGSCAETALAGLERSCRGWSWWGAAGGLVGGAPGCLGCWRFAGGVGWRCGGVGAGEGTSSSAGVVQRGVLDHTGPPASVGGPPTRRGAQPGERADPTVGEDPLDGADDGLSAHPAGEALPARAVRSVTQSVLDAHHATSEKLTGPGASMSAASGVAHRP